MDVAAGTALSDTRKKVVVVAAAWLFGFAALAIVRCRVHWDFYMAFHRWMAARGVPEAVRNLDSMVIYICAAMLGAWVVTWIAGGCFCEMLRLRRPGESPVGPLPRGWAVMAACACAPMVVGGVLLGFHRGGDWTLAPVLPQVIRAPLGEEFVYRALLVAVPAAVFGWHGRSYRINMLLAALLFGATHISWTLAGLSAGWPNLLVTFIGGVWYAWLVKRWQLIWVTVVLHAGMNLGWLLSRAAGGAGGGGVTENVLRVATIVVATVWTVRATRRTQ